MTEWTEWRTAALVMTRLAWERTAAGDELATAVREWVDPESEVSDVLRVEQAEVAWWATRNGTQHAGQPPTVDDELVEIAAAWLHSWAGDQVGHSWDQCGPARKATMRARARGVLNIMRHGSPSDVHAEQAS